MVLCIVIGKTALITCLVFFVGYTHAGLLNVLLLLNHTGHYKTMGVPTVSNLLPLNNIY